ncbi:16S rRNA (uracil(1498)-N(3))-methyltransferase [Pseudanabaena sp. PCC 6802]|uniref:16S rRNA (uracil(1498)-N(3))-methyltransferase n=1 Tax=Pseudanabaena sp. PCC 6802 TaxID=118173 RepID=UPI000345493C|nr:16S rRNA (uracil(1498)-N(3))-methyltransferase [Pseudanabaena sp. PCC 6802]
MKPQHSHLQRLVLQPQQSTRLLVPSAQIELTPAQQHYLAHVLRLKPGAEFIALNGKGQWWRAELLADLKTAAIAEEIIAHTELPIPVTLAIAMPKGNGMEAVIRTCTELGISRIVPLWSDRTVVKSGTSMGVQKLERWQRIAQEASEQSLRTYVPEIVEPQAFADWSIQPHPGDRVRKFICVTHGDRSHLLNSMLEICHQKQLSDVIWVVTGPEGGWTKDEEELAIDHDFKPVALGDRILAATTAPVVALSIISAVISTI